ncbi:MAG TPA: LAGLIDADG family homing endonuclease [Phycisphaerae bacterium]|nr:LAGLIDADG family homing endonuclease [Phycisphaerae bacterium]
MKISRRFTKAGVDVFSTVEWSKRTSRIMHTDGTVVFEMKDAEIPADWSQLATDIVVSKYFRKAGVPQVDGEGKALLDEAGKPRTGPEKSVKQVVHRLAGCWTHWGKQHGYFTTEEDAAAFYDELAYMLLHQIAAPNSPQWFNTGLNFAYGLTGPSQGHWHVNPTTGKLEQTSDAYTHPQPHACFIQSVDDDLVNEGGIMDLWTREARLFKYGSGTGTNFSKVRGENESLSGGGKSSGLMSFLKIGDRAAGAIKSGGTTRRAAKMVCLDLDHPDIEEFVNWKVREEIKVACLVEGIKHLPKEQQELAKKMKLKLDYDFNGEAYMTVSGQNSNNSVRVANKFLKAVETDGDWQTFKRINGKVHKTLKARDLWGQIAYAAWRCADPGVQYDDTINEWHTCPKSGRINASNPCVTGDTLVATTTGFKRIIDLVGKSAEIINGDGNAVFVNHIFKTGHKDVYELKTRAGYTLKLTADHKVKTANRGDVAACELSVDDFVTLEEPGFGDDFVPEAFGELLGAALGDGCLTSGHDQEMLFITLGENEANLAGHLQANINECKRWLSDGDGRGVRETEVVTTPTGLRVGTSVRALVDRFRAFATLDCGSDNKAFTDDVFRLDQRSIAAVLRGVFTTDGTVANYGEKSQYVALDSTSLKLVRQVQMLLLGFGIKAKIYENRRAIGNATALLPDGKGGTRLYPVRQMHSLRISRGSRVLFEREIGFITGTAKATRLAELNRTVGAYSESFTDRVASLTHLGAEDVYDLTEPVSHHFVANGIVVHNCSEYMFLDNTACNLASINLMKLFNERTRQFDFEGFKHACRLWTIVLEISVLMAAYPSREIARLSYEYRTLGLGYANVGTMLMVSGIPYDSDTGRAICGAVSAIMTGESYATSAEMARELGAFPGFENNREDMLRVMRNHRAAAYDNPAEYEALTVRPMGIDASRFNGKHPNTVSLLHAARECWDRALALGEQYGYRNAQTTCIAPTGTIGLLMDCDTTGVEPDFALVKFKKLAGGGYFKIANGSLEPALATLGYTDAQIKDILTYVLGTLTLKGAPHINQEVLKAKGFTDEELAKIEACLPSVFELAFAFSPWSLGEDAMQRLGFARDQWQKPGFNLLRALGFSKRQIREANEIICGSQTIEGSPHLKQEHYAVFDCANKCGRKGQRFIHHSGHIKMMAAAQPFISGAISKTINMPNEVSVGDIEEAYLESWKLSLKAVALYRDGSKLSQPLNSVSDDDASDDQDVDALKQENAVGGGGCKTCGDPSLAMECKTDLAEPVKISEPVEKVVVKVVERPLRRRLPDTRASITHKFDIAGHEGYITVGLFEDNTPGEVFITMAKQGSTIGGLMDTIATLISLNLQYGVPVDAIVRKFEHMRFEPGGMTMNPDIPFAKSFVDYIVRWLGMQFVPGYRAANAPKRESQMNSVEPATAGDLGEAPVEAPALPTGGRQIVRDALAATERPKGNGNGHGHAAGPEMMTATLNIAMGTLMGDAPTCTCGSITVRNGSCYKCLNCGASLGCS